jgi:hypothetical protein
LYRGGVWNYGVGWQNSGRLGALDRRCIHGFGIAIVTHAIDFRGRPELLARTTVMAACGVLAKMNVSRNPA